jgi:MFS family permease
MQLIAIYLMSAFVGVGIGIVGPLIPLLLAGSGASGSQVGLAATLMFTGLGTAALAAGHITDRRGPKSGIVFGAAVYAFALMLLPLARRYTEFLAIRALEGVGIGILVVSLEAAINLIVAAERRGRAMGTYALLFAAGVAAGPTIGVLLQSSLALPFRAAAATTGIAALFMLAAFHNVVPEKRPQPLFYTGLFVSLWGPILAVLLYALIEVTMMSLYPLYLTHAGWRSERVSLLFSIYACGAVVSPLIAGAVSDRLKREWVMIACGVLLLLGTAFVSLSSGMGWLAMMTAVMGMAAGGIYPIGLSMIGDRAPAHQLGAANSLFTSAYSAGSIIGPLGVGVIMDFFGAQALFRPLMVVALAFLILAIADAKHYLPVAKAWKP